MMATSHPAWVCGLKQKSRKVDKRSIVTPCVGVWIETAASPVCPGMESGHTLRGCVD